MAPHANGLLGFVTTPEFIVARNTKERFLAALSWCYKQTPSRFPLIADTIRGRHRVYFSLDPAEIESTGTSTNPQRIPGSPYWVVTNASNDHKCGILNDVLTDVLGCDPDAVSRSLSHL